MDLLDPNRATERGMAWASNHYAAEYHEPTCKLLRLWKDYFTEALQNPSETYKGAVSEP